MSSLPLFYQKVAPVNQKNHGNWRMEPAKGYTFAAQTNSIYVAAVEFTRAAAEYPIVFAKSAEDSVFPVVLLGLQNAHNVFIDSKGQWQANYIPAYVRRYPFILAETQQNGESSFTVCLDEAYSGFTQKSQKGSALFEDDGQPSELLQRSIEFLKEYQTHIEATRRFCVLLADLDLLEAVRADVSLPSGEKQALGGFLCVSPARLKKLPDDKLAQLVRDEHMPLIYSHLQSLSNLNSLFKRRNTGKPRASSKLN